MAPNRIVALLTPLVFAPLAGAIASWTAKHFPGFEVSQSALEEIFIAGALIALAPAAQWLHGWQKYEAREAQAEQAVELAAAAATGPALAGAAGGAEAGLDDLAGAAELDELADLDDELLADEDALDDELLAGEEQAPTPA